MIPNIFSQVPRADPGPNRPGDRKNPGFFAAKSGPRDARGGNRGFRGLKFIFNIFMMIFRSLAWLDLPRFHVPLVPTHFWARTGDSYPSAQIPLRDQHDLRVGRGPWPSRRRVRGLQWNGPLVAARGCYVRAAGGGFRPAWAARTRRGSTGRPLTGSHGVSAQMELKVSGGHPQRQSIDRTQGYKPRPFYGTVLA